MVPEDPIAKRVFSIADQEAFARLSGDCNPMHLDETLSRRTMAGARVVHGMHGALWALEELVGTGVQLANLATLKVQFAKFVYLEQNVYLRIVRRSDLALKAELATETGVATTINLRFGPPRSNASSKFERTMPDSYFERPRRLALEDMEGLMGSLSTPPSDEFCRRFRALCFSLGENRVMSLALLSTLVGMVCPGLHSIFAGFDIEFLADDADLPRLSWQTMRADERFRRIVMQVRGTGFEGEVQAFARPEPVEPPPMAELKNKVLSEEFSGRTALVVGGARGLGAVTAKLLAAGGARVIATYASGREEADALVADVRAAGGCASALHCDITGNVEDDLVGLRGEVTDIYYFATPRIGQEKAQIYTRDRFEAFVRFYVDGFLKVIGCLASQEGSALRSALYPSTIFLDDRPKGMTEYAMAKAAGEILARDLGEALGIRIDIPRIPKLLTDQTSGLTPIDVANSVEVMLSLLRAEN